MECASRIVEEVQLAPTLEQRLSRALFEFTNQRPDLKNGTLVQIWMPEVSQDGSTVLSAQGLPFAVNSIGDLLAMFRCVSVRYRFGTDVNRPALMGAIGRVFSTLEPEMSNNVQRYDRKIYARVEAAQRCNVYSTLVVPIFGPQASRQRDGPLAVFELVQNSQDVDFPAVISLLCQSLQKVNLHTVDKDTTALSVALQPSWHREPRWKNYRMACEAAAGTTAATAAAAAAAAAGGQGYHSGSCTSDSTNEDSGGDRQGGERGRLPQTVTMMSVASPGGTVQDEVDSLAGQQNSLAGQQNSDARRLQVSEAGLKAAHTHAAGTSGQAQLNASTFSGSGQVAHLVPYSAAAAVPDRQHSTGAVFVAQLPLASHLSQPPYDARPATSTSQPLVHVMGVDANGVMAGVSWQQQQQQQQRQPMFMQQQLQLQQSHQQASQQLQHSSIQQPQHHQQSHPQQQRAPPPLTTTSISLAQEDAFDAWERQGQQQQQQQQETVAQAQAPSSDAALPRSGSLASLNCNKKFLSAPNTAGGSHQQQAAPLLVQAQQHHQHQHQGLQPLYQQQQPVLQPPFHQAAPAPASAPSTHGGLLQPGSIVNINGTPAVLIAAGHDGSPPAQQGSLMQPSASQQQLPHHLYSHQPHQAHQQQPQKHFVVQAQPPASGVSLLRTGSLSNLGGGAGGGNTFIIPSGGAGTAPQMGFISGASFASGFVGGEYGGTAGPSGGNAVPVMVLICQPQGMMPPPPPPSQHQLQQQQQQHHVGQQLQQQQHHVGQQLQQGGQQAQHASSSMQQQHLHAQQQSQLRSTSAGSVRRKRHSHGGGTGGTPGDEFSSSDDDLDRNTFDAPSHRGLPHHNGGTVGANGGITGSVMGGGTTLGSSMQGIGKADIIALLSASAPHNRTSGKHITFEQLQGQFGAGLKDAANNLGVCASTLKRVCRRFGIKCWPRRQIIKFNKALTEIGYIGGEAVANAAGGQQVVGGDHAGYSGDTLAGHAALAGRNDQAGLPVDARTRHTAELAGHHFSVGTSFPLNADCGSSAGLTSSYAAAVALGGRGGTGSPPPPDGSGHGENGVGLLLSSMMASSGGVGSAAYASANLTTGTSNSGLPMAMAAAATGAAASFGLPSSGDGRQQQQMPPPVGYWPHGGVCGTFLRSCGTGVHGEAAGAAVTVLDGDLSTHGSNNTLPVVNTAAPPLAGDASLRLRGTSPAGQLAAGVLSGSTPGVAGGPGDGLDALFEDDSGAFDQLWDMLGKEEHEEQDDGGGGAFAQRLQDVAVHGGAYAAIEIGKHFRMESAS